jgi:hypothetical protein
VLNPNHKEGQHKARRFRERLDYLQEDATLLKQILLQTIEAMNFPDDFTLKQEDEYGIRYEILLSVPSKTSHSNPAKVCTAWIKRPHEPDILSLITCYISE